MAQHQALALVLHEPRLATAAAGGQVFGGRLGLEQAGRVACVDAARVVPERVAVPRGDLDRSECRAVDIAQQRAQVGLRAAPRRGGRR
ncbi:hypothetical protein SOM08_06385 [Hydrogenophaga sp. SNF1]|uniref:hypothetical protein n=1 Tax=Hydrogenophaga sp. SNF1 TaxID=3098762 RepID=UPI002ACC05DC|nr:hypothetical protein [Hydrogenophaga sp. SNF1]WQB85976.1 hypothetical protein SOM08_06385 [Hydrogenophaga sp. SNF1]